MSLYLDFLEIELSSSLANTSGHAAQSDNLFLPTELLQRAERHLWKSTEHLLATLFSSGG